MGKIHGVGECLTLQQTWCQLGKAPLGLEPVEKPRPSYAPPDRQLYKTYRDDKLRQTCERTGTSRLHRNSLEVALVFDLRPIEDRLFPRSHHAKNIESPIDINDFAGNSASQRTD